MFHTARIRRLGSHSPGKTDVRKGRAMFPPLCDKEFRVWFQIPKGSLVCNRPGHRESMRKLKVYTSHTRWGQLPGDKGFLFTFVRVVCTLYASVKTGEAKWPLGWFPMEAEWPRASSDSRNEVIETPWDTHTHVQQQSVSRHPRGGSQALMPAVRGRCCSGQPRILPKLLCHLLPESQNLSWLSPTVPGDVAIHV